MAKKSSTKKLSPVKLIAMAVIVIALVVSVGLVKNNQENRSKAASPKIIPNFAISLTVKPGSYKCGYGKNSNTVFYCKGIRGGGNCSRLVTYQSILAGEWIEVKHCWTSYCKDTKVSSDNTGSKYTAICKDNKDSKNNINYDKPCPTASFINGNCSYRCSFGYCLDMPHSGFKVGMSCKYGQKSNKEGVITGIGEEWCAVSSKYCCSPKNQITNTTNSIKYRLNKVNGNCTDGSSDPSWLAGCGGKGSEYYDPNCFDTVAACQDEFKCNPFRQGIFDTTKVSNSRCNGSSFQKCSWVKTGHGYFDWVTVQNCNSNQTCIVGQGCVTFDRR